MDEWGKGATRAHLYYQSLKTSMDFAQYLTCHTTLVGMATITDQPTSFMKKQRCVISTHSPADSVYPKPHHLLPLPIFPTPHPRIPLPMTPLKPISKTSSNSSSSSSSSSSSKSEFLVVPLHPWLVHDHSFTNRSLCLQQQLSSALTL